MRLWNIFLRLADWREYHLVRKHQGMICKKEPWTNRRAQHRDAKRLVLKGRIWAFPYLTALDEERLIIPKIIFEIQQRLDRRSQEAGENAEEHFQDSPEQLFLSLLLRCYGELRRAFAFLFCLLVILGGLGLALCFLVLGK